MKRIISRSRAEKLFGGRPQLDLALRKAFEVELSQPGRFHLEAVIGDFRAEYGNAYVCAKRNSEGTDWGFIVYAKNKESLRRISEDLRKGQRGDFLNPPQPPISRPKK